jgi:hypothetical protein
VWLCDALWLTQGGGVMTVLDDGEWLLQLGLPGSVGQLMVMLRRYRA